jgi:hypothetical protein
VFVCPTGFHGATVDIHQRNPEATITVHICLQN